MEKNCQAFVGYFKNLFGEKLILNCDISLKPLKNLRAKVFNKVIV